MNQNELIQKHQQGKHSCIPIEHCVFVKTADDTIHEVLTGVVHKDTNKCYFLLMENNGSWFYNTFGGAYKCFCNYLGHHETTDIYEYRLSVPKYQF